LVRMHIRLTEEQVGKVRKIAARRGVPMAKVIRDAVEGAIVSDDRRERALDIVGKFRSGRRDVSKRHDAHLTAIRGSQQRDEGE
jgi:hypothetical protein